jgi:hypothetical protein
VVVLSADGSEDRKVDPSVGYRLVPPANGHQSLTPEESQR